MHAGIAGDMGVKSCGSWPVLREPSTIPTIASWYPADLSKAQGKQKLFAHPSPQKLKLLREHALIEIAISSNRIEGVNNAPSRTLLLTSISHSCQ